MKITKDGYYQYSLKEIYEMGFDEYTQMLLFGFSIKEKKK